jgi:hypothetical protein
MKVLETKGRTVVTKLECNCGKEVKIGEKWSQCECGLWWDNKGWMMRPDQYESLMAIQYLRSQGATWQDIKDFKKFRDEWGYTNDEALGLFRRVYCPATAGTVPEDECSGCDFC